MPRRPGPKPHSADVIELGGNRSKLSAEEIERRRAEEVKPRPLRPEPPEWLSPFALECWQMHAPELEHLGLLTRLDAGAFVLACEAYGLAREALEELRVKKADGTPDQRTKRRTVVDVDRVHGGMLKKHPAFSVFTQSSNLYLRFCGEFGLTPSSRVSLRPGASGPSLEEGPGGDADDAFFGG